MRQVVITLSDAMFAELERASARTFDSGFGPDAWASEAVESALASRRLPHVKQGGHGARIKAAVEEREPVTHRVAWPEGLNDYASEALCPPTY